VAKNHPRSRGVFNYNDLSDGQKTQLLQRIPVHEVWGIGRQLTQRLLQHGVRSVLDLREAHVATLRAEFGVVMEKTQRELQEIPCVDLQEVQPARQQIISSRSFGQMVTELPVLQDALSSFVANACTKLRAQDSHAAVIQVFLQTNRFREDLPQYMPSLAVPLAYPTNDTREVNRWAHHLCSQMFKPGYSYKKAGVVLSDISPVTHRQGDLLEPAQLPNHSLMQALDRLNQRFGRGTVKVSTQGAYTQWQMRQERKSPNYTTDWEEMPAAAS
jgi:DNA polymerase V